MDRRGCREDRERSQVERGQVRALRQPAGHEAKRRHPHRRRQEAGLVQRSRRKHPRAGRGVAMNAQDHVAKASATIDAPVERVWEALVTPSIIRQYMFGTNVDSDWKLGSPITWKGEWEGKAYEDKGVIQKIERPRVLQYTHFSPLSGLPEKPENFHTITIELSPNGSQTGVSLSQDHNPTDEERAHSEKNWNMMLEGLK